MRIIIATPSDLTDTEIARATDLIKMGGEVQQAGLVARVRRCKLLALGYLDKKLVGMAAIKDPNDGYVSGVESKSGLSLQPGIRELGYVVVDPEARGKGIARHLCELLLCAFKDPLFATTRADNDPMVKILVQTGFQRGPTVWDSTEHPGHSVVGWLLTSRTTQVTTHRVKRSIAHTSSRGGDIAELQVAYWFASCGFNIAKPLWGDDEVDLVVVDKRARSSMVSIGIQVKSLQFLDGKKHREIEGLRKAYIDNNPFLILVVSSTDLDGFWLVPGRDNIKDLYNAQISRRKKHMDDFDSIPPPMDKNGTSRPELTEVRLRFDLPPGVEWDRFYIAPGDQEMLTQVMHSWALRIKGHDELVTALNRLWSNN